jgi:hypothetical protein
MDSDEEEFMDHMHKIEDEQKQEDKKLVKGCRVTVKLPEWEEKYRGKITRPFSNKTGIYTVKLDDDENGEEYENLKKVKREYITIVPEEVINEENIMNEIKDLVKTRKTKGKEAMISQFEKICKIQEKYDKKKKNKENKKKQKTNVTKLRKLLRTKNIMNDFKYFKNMEVENQEKIISQLE